MDNNKKPSGPVEEERWAKIEKEVQELKRSRSMCARRLGYKSANSFASAVSHGLSGSHRTYKHTFARERIDRSEVDSLPPVRTIRKKPAGAPTPTSCKG